MLSFDATLHFVAFFWYQESLAAFEGGSFSRSSSELSTTSAAEDGDVRYSYNPLVGRPKIYK